MFSKKEIESDPRDVLSVNEVEEINRLPEEELKKEIQKHNADAKERKIRQIIAVSFVVIVLIVLAML